MKRKKAIYKSVIGVTLSSVLLTGTPISVLPGLSNLPVLSDTVITAKASGDCYELSNGVLTLKGNIITNEIKYLPQREQVKTIKVADGAKFPEDCYSLFMGYKNCTSIDLTGANTNHITEVSQMFRECENLQTVNLGSFATEGITSTHMMFHGCKKLKEVEFERFNTQNVTDMTRMFSDCESLQSLDVGVLDTSKVTTMASMFSGCKNLKNLSTKYFDTTNVTNMDRMFENCGFETLNLSHFNTQNVTSMQSMFSGCSKLKELYLDNFNTEKVTDMSSMFSGCSKLESLDLSGFHTDSLRYLSATFLYCSNLKKIRMDNFDTSKIDRMGSLFNGCNSLEELDLRNFTLKSGCDYQYMLNCKNLRILKLGRSFQTVDDVFQLPNGKSGWACNSPTGPRISGDETYAHFINQGDNVYYKICKLTGQIGMYGNVKNPTIGDTLTVSALFDECPQENQFFQWIRDDSTYVAVDTDTYTITKEDVGSIITCVATDVKHVYTGDIRVSTQSTVRKLPGLDAPTNLVGIAPTKLGGNNGKITGVTTAMEYSTKADFSSGVKKCTSQAISNLKAGTYYVRYAESDTNLAGDYTTVIVEDGLGDLIGSVTINGNLIYGQKLKATVTGCNAKNLAYQWRREGKAIKGATSSTYTLQESDIGSHISVVVSDKDKQTLGNILYETSETVAKQNGPAAPTNLESKPSSKQGAADGQITGVTSAMEYATNSSFIDKKSCSGNVIKGLVSGIYYVRYAETSTTKAGKAVTIRVDIKKEKLSGTVTISGTTKYGKTLTAKVTNSNTTKFSYQWKRSGKAISGATAATYKLTKDDIGKTLTCVVTDTNGNYNGSIESKATSKIAKADAPAAPTGLKGVAPSKKGASDGKITGVKTTMEYSTKSDFSSNVTTCTSTSITKLKAGTYYVRLKETETTKAGKAAKVTVPAGKDDSESKGDVTKVFTDVKKGEWYVNAVQYVYDNSYMNGTGTTTFSPLMTLNRGQFVTVLYNVAGTPKTKFVKDRFKDVKEGDFFALPVMWAADNDITSGTGDKKFSPNANITREQMALMLYKFAQYKKFKITTNSTALDGFPDKKKVDSWAKEAMQWAVTNKIINGKTGSNGKNLLDPLGKATRAECAQVIMNFMTQYNSK